MSVKENEIKMDIVTKDEEGSEETMAAIRGDQELKHEVVTAYNEVLRKLTVMKGMASKEEQEKERQDEEVAQEVKYFVEVEARETADDLISNVSDLKVFLNKELKILEEKLLPLYDKFHTLRRAINFSEKELSNLHDITMNANTLNALMLAQKEKAATFEREMAERRRAFEHERAHQERSRVQEESAYVLNRDATRKLDEEQHETLKRELECELHIKRTAFEEDVASREARLASREQEHQQLKEREARITARDQEYHQLKEKVARFPDELRMTVQKAERTIMDQLTRKHEHDARMANIELESERKLNQQKIAALEEQIEQYKLLRQQFGQRP